MVGNGCTNWTYDSTADAGTYANFNVIPKQWWQDYTDLGCWSGPVDLGPKPAACIPLSAKIAQQVGDLNWYDLYRPLLRFKSSSENGDDRLGEAIVDGEVKTYKKGMTMGEYTPWASYMFATEADASQVRLNDFVTDYMNLEETRVAFNIPSEVQAWEQCSNIDYTIGAESSMWIYPLLKDRYRMMFYSGDTDAAVATYGSKQWINDLGWKVTDEWRAWQTEGQDSGFTEKREGLDFYTVKGVGHMAPQWKRGPVNTMIMSWMHGNPL